MIENDRSVKMNKKMDFVKISQFSTALSPRKNLIFCAFGHDEYLQSFLESC